MPIQNRLIEGDNLKVLATLPTESVDLVCTDPPYNTGGNRFRYNDRWKEHAAWVDFMADRLQLMKRVLKPSGVIAICIGKKELFHLGVLMDKIFDEDNQLGIINWQKTYAPKNDVKHIADTTDYVLVYAKTRLSAQDKPAFSMMAGSLWGMDDPCFDENSMKIGDVPMVAFSSSWYNTHFELGCQSWKHEQSGHNQEATRLLDAIMGEGHKVSTPKPLKLIEKIIQLWCPSDGVVLDAFAGSGTTGHAVLELNARVGTKRSFILIEQGNPSTGDSFAQTLTAERLRRVISGKWSSGKQPPLPGSFTFQSHANIEEVA
jgi:adenine specific DNA methylase Mod